MANAEVLIKKSDIEKREAKLKDAQREADRLKKELQKVEPSIKGANDRAAQAEKKYAAERESNLANIQELHRADTEVGNLRKELASVREANSKLVHDNFQALSKVNVERDAVLEESAKLKVQVANLEKERTDLKNRVGKLEVVESDTRSLRTRLQTKSEELIKMQRKLMELRNLRELVMKDALNRMGHKRLPPGPDTERLTLDVEKEADGRWLAAIIELPGIMDYGDTKAGAIRAAVELLVKSEEPVKVEEAQVGTAAIPAPTTTTTAAVNGLIDFLPK